MNAPAYFSAITWLNDDLREIMHSGLRRYDLRPLEVRNYVHASESLLNLFTRSGPEAQDALKVFVGDLRERAGTPDCDTRAEQFTALLHEHALQGGRWQKPIIIVNRRQTDPAWLQSRTVFQRLLGDPEGYVTLVLSDWDDGHWQRLIEQALVFRLGLPNSTSWSVAAYDQRADGVVS